MSRLRKEQKFAGVLFDSNADARNKLDEHSQVQAEHEMRMQAESEEQQRQETRQRRRSEAKQDFGYFCQTYLPDAFPIPFAEYQLALMRLVSERVLTRNDELLFKHLVDPSDHGFIAQPITGHYDGILDIEPRDHGKTTRNTQALPLWLALNFPGSFIVIAGHDKESAAEMMDAIKTKLVEDEDIIEDYGEQKVRGNVWSKFKIQLANGSSIVARGRGQSLRGIKNKFQRPTHIICDDLLDDQEVESATQRRKAYKWFKRVILNLGKGALVLVANTIMHPDDLPSTLLSEIEEGLLPNWMGLRFSAITPDGQSLFPGRWPLEDLLLKQTTLGALWWTEWMNRPVAEEDQAFREEWLTYFEAHNIDLRDCDVGMGVDPATGSSTGDYSAIAVVAHHRPTGLYYVLYCDGWRESDLAFAKRIVDIYCLYPDISVIHFEDVVFQKIYKRDVLRYASKRGVRLPIKGFKGGNKFIRIKSLSPMVENGLLLFLEKQRLLKEQLIAFPRGHDDCPDAVEMVIDGFETKFVGVASVTRQRIMSAAGRMASIGCGALGRALR